MDIKSKNPELFNFIIFMTIINILLFVMLCSNIFYYNNPILGKYLIVFLIGLTLEIYAKTILFLKKEKENRPLEIKSKYNTERAWKYYDSADIIHHQRTNYFLVAESMLLFSFVTLFVNNHNSILFKSLQLSIALVGAIVTLSWFYVNIRLVIKMNKLMTKYLIKNDPVYYDYVKSVRHSPSAGFFLSCILPVSIMLLWIYMIYSSFGFTTEGFIENLLPYYILAFVGIRLIFKKGLPQDD